MDEIYDIIHKCALLGATKVHLSTEKLEVEFGNGPKPPEATIISAASTPQATKPTPDSGESELNENYFERDPKVVEAEDDLAELQITDPLEFEERLARGEIVDAGSTDDGSGDEGQ